MTLSEIEALKAELIEWKRLALSNKEEHISALWTLAFGLATVAGLFIWHMFTAH